MTAHLVQQFEIFFPGLLRKIGCVQCLADSACRSWLRFTLGSKGRTCLVYCIDGDLGIAPENTIGDVVLIHTQTHYLDYRGHVFKLTFKPNFFEVINR